MASPGRLPPELMDKVAEKVFLRFPRTDPARLMRAALVCKRWGRLISSPRFRRRYRGVHRLPIMLGLLCNIRDESGMPVSRFFPTCPSGPRDTDFHGWRALDSRHGRVLLRSLVRGGYLDVWDPVTGKRREVPASPLRPYNWNAAVLCLFHGTCDHLDCHRGSFLVVVLGADDDEAMSLCVYSSVKASWSEPLRVAPLPEYGIDPVPPLLIGNVLHFGIDFSRSILKYDLATRTPSVIPQPPGSFGHFSVLMNDKGLEVATMVGSTLRFSMYDSQGGTSWAPPTVVELNDWIPVRALPVSSDFVGYAQASRVFFVDTMNGLYITDLATRKVWKVLNDKGIMGVVPYITEYVPALPLPLLVRDQLELRVYERYKKLD